MKHIQDIYSGKKIIARVFKKFPFTDGAYFISHPSEPLQVGFHSTETRKVLNPHKHPPINVSKKLKMHEVLIIVEGTITIAFYSKTNELISKVRLSKNQGITVMDVVHQVTFSKGAKVVEIKQGPYQK